MKDYFVLCFFIVLALGCRTKESSELAHDESKPTADTFPTIAWFEFSDENYESYLVESLRYELTRDAFRKSSILRNPKDRLQAQLQKKVDVLHSYLVLYG